MNYIVVGRVAARRLEINQNIVNERHTERGYRDESVTRIGIRWRQTLDGIGTERKGKELRLVRKKVFTFIRARKTRG